VRHKAHLPKERSLKKFARNFANGNPEFHFGSFDHATLKKLLIETGLIDSGNHAILSILTNLNVFVKNNNQGCNSRNYFKTSYDHYLEIVYSK